MQSKEKDNLIIVRLFPEEEVVGCLKKLCQKYRVKTAVILSGLGQLGKFSLGFFKKKGDYAQEDFTEPHELLLLTGNVSSSPDHNRSRAPQALKTTKSAPVCCGDKQQNEYDFHLHAVLGDAKKQVVGGHFIKGIVSVTGEIVLLKTDLQVERQVEKETGLKGLFLE